MSQSSLHPNKEQLMSPSKISSRKKHRIEDVTDFQQIPNVGPATAADLQLLGIRKPQQLASQDPVALYERLSRLTRTRQDPCVLDVFMAIVDFARGGKPKPWWEFTSQRKRIYRDVENRVR
jgi:hypothetical protein